MGRGVVPPSCSGLLVSANVSTLRQRSGKSITAARRGKGVALMAIVAATAVWVPFVRPCWSGGVFVFVQVAAESVGPSRVEVNDPGLLSDSALSVVMALRHRGGGAS